MLPTFRATATESCLDRILFPTAFLQNLQLRSSTSVRWVGDKLRHGIVTLRLKHKSTVPPDPKLPKHHTIPPYIFRPGMEGPVLNRQAIEAIQDLERRIMQEPKQAHTTDSLTALFWAWWRTVTPEHKRRQADIAALIQACLKQKGVHVRMRASTYEALTKSTGTAIDSRPIKDGTREIARSELYKALELLDAQAITYTLTPKNTPDIASDRTSSTHFWQRMRELKTTQGTYNGPMYRANGQRCNTVPDLDQAMTSQLATPPCRIQSGQQTLPTLPRPHHHQNSVTPPPHQGIGTRA